MVTDRGTDWDPSAKAPDGLERVRRFMNSLDLYRARDQLSDVEQAQQLLRDLSDVGGEVRVDTSLLPELRLARAAMRQLVGCATLWALPEHDSTPDAEPDWSTSPRLLLGPNGFAPDGHDLHTLLAGMALELYVAQRSGSVARLKPCANPACQWIFWDVSRPGTGRWCSMRLCGGQHKSRQFRARRASATPGE